MDISQFLSGGEVGMALPVIDWAAEMESQGAMLDENPGRTYSFPFL